jgi:hypothetical protein
MDLGNISGKTVILIHLSEVPAKVGEKFPESRKYVRQKTDTYFGLTIGKNPTFG